ncbi:MAG: T9SS type A sorting domain-containing protein [Fidelibacterota bacterium]
MKQAGSIFVLILVMTASTFAREKGWISSSPRLARAAQEESPAQTTVNVNNITVWVRGDGFHDWVIDGSWNGTFPKGKAGVIFSEGMVWGGFVNDGTTPDLRVGGSTYKSGNQAGRIESGGIAGEKVRPYRVRPDWVTVDLTDDAANFFLKSVEDVTSGDIETLRSWYETDWNEWPADLGAPYEEINGVPGYQPATWDSENNVWNTDGDIPGVTGAHQTMWIVYNDLDPGLTAALYGSPPIGLEGQETYWAYALDNPMGNVVFKRLRLIYKGKADTPADAIIEDMYVSQWVDPDMGQYTDDLAGSDTALSLGYVYNSSNSDNVWDSWGLAPPAAGYDFLQGPIIFTGNPADSALFDFVYRKGYINLPMTSFVPFAAGSPRSDPDLNTYDGTKQWYNLMRCCEPRPEYPDCEPVMDHLGNPTCLELSGDPVLGGGDLDGAPNPFDGIPFSPGDRRLTMSTGPFNMALGDTQEVVVALIGASGQNFLQSVAILKFNDLFAQEAYDNVFDLPSGPPAPDLNIVELDRELILEWESNTDQVAATESSNIKGYKFEGYNVYQLPNATAGKDEAALLATYDLETAPGYIFQPVFDPDAGVAIEKPVQFGVNSGITRYLRITTDAFTGDRLINGKTYFFAVTAYNANMSEDVSTHTFESPLTQSLRSAIPHEPNPQTVYSYSLDDTVEVTNVVGKNDAVAVPVILDPEAPNGETFEIHYSVVDDAKSIDFIRTDVSPVDTLLAQLGIGDNDTTFRYLHLGGFAITLADASSGVKAVSGNGENILGTSNPASPVYEYTSAEALAGGAIDENDYELRFTAGGSWALAGPPGAFLTGTYWIRVPFEVWDLGFEEGSDDDQQIFAYFFDEAADREWNTAGNDKIDGKPVFDKLEIAKVSYPSDDDTLSVPASDKVKIFLPGTFKSIDEIILVDRTGTGDAPPAGTSIVFGTFKGVRDGDVKTFSVGKVQRTATGDEPKERVKEITVFPNPYLGMNTWETSRFDKYVTFSHLPRKVTVRIYTLSGVLVRTLTEQDKSDEESQFLRWDLRNEFNLPVASGLYIAHIDMPDLKEEAVLKLAIVQEQQVLRSY